MDTKIRGQITQEVVAIQGLLDKKISIGEIDQKTKKIINLGEPTSAKDAATKDFVEKSHLSQSGIQKNEFFYLMTDVNESSSESTITVKGILKFPQTPHTIFKNAYKFLMGKDNQNKYASRLGFNFYQLPAGAYTFVVEFFPPTGVNVSIDCRSTPINVNKQVFKQFPGYWKNLVQLEKFKITPPEYLMVDIKCDGDASSPANGEGWMIVYGISGTHHDVPSAVLDTSSIIQNGQEIMQVDLNMNGKRITNLPDPTGNQQAATKIYVDNSGLTSMLENATAVFVDNYIQEHAECLYSVERGQKTEVTFSKTRDISTLFDKTLSGLNALQNDASKKPKLSTAKNARRFFFTFDGDDRLISNVNLNAQRGKRDAVHAFILYYLRTHNTGSHSQFRNGLFGHDNGGWDKFVCFHKTNHNLLIGGTFNNSDSAFSGDNIQVTSSDFKTRANPSELNKWCCLSVHWDVSGGRGQSSVWVNGKKLKTFQAKAKSGTPQMVLGDVSTVGTAGLDGNIQLFIAYKSWGMTDLVIKAHHKMICERYGVDHDEISFP